MNDPQFLNFDQMHYEIDEYPLSSIEQLERTFCTNFSCCNIVLPDLHALLDHYDLTTSGHHSIPRSSPLPPLTQSPSMSPPSSPESSGSPHLFPPRKYITPDSPTCVSNATEIPVPAPFVYHPDAYALSEYPTYEHCYDAAASPEPQNLQKIPMASALFNIPTAHSGSRPLGLDIDFKGQRRRASSSAPSEHRKNPMKRKSKIDLTGAPLSTPRKRNKKAPYQCPTPGCTKSYLNPNGLKYHQEKGTCNFEVVSSSVSVLPRHPTPAAAAIVPVEPLSSNVHVSTNSTTISDHAHQLASPIGPPDHRHIHHPQPRQSLFNVVQWTSHIEQGINVGGDPAPNTV